MGSSEYDLGRSSDAIFEDSINFKRNFRTDTEKINI